MHKVVIIDDDRTFLQLLKQQISESCPSLEVVTCDNPVQGLKEIQPDIDLLLLDLEMPGLDGTKLLAYARERGLSKGKIIVLSGRDAEYLHKQIPMGHCLAVLNKHEARQKAVLEMVFNSLETKCCEPPDN